MGLLDEAGLDRLVSAGCPGCGATTLIFSAYLDGKVPFIGAEPVGRVTWSYDGEKFVDGVYQVTCAGCGQTAFEASVCPRCHAEGGLARALATPTSLPVPAHCPDADCGGEEIHLLAFLPARVAYEGKRAAPARTAIEPHDDGFHGSRAVCRVCRQAAAELVERCPLCDAPGPLRARP